MSQAFYTDAQQSQVRRVIPELIDSRELLFDLIWKDVRVRYRYATMGFLWAVLEPLFMMIVLTFVFSFVFKGKVEAHGIATGPAYAVFILSGLIPWQFFSTSISTATRSLVDNRTLITKVRFPREVVPLSSVGVATVNLAIGSVLMLLVYAVLMKQLPGIAVLWLPVIFSIQLMLVIGLALLLSCANAPFRDVAYMTDAALLFGFYATPIFYPPELVQRELPGWYAAYMLNPMASLITAYRQVLFDNHFPDLSLLIAPVLIAIIVLAIGVVIFRRNAPLLADRL